MGFPVLFVSKANKPLHLSFNYCILIKAKGRLLFLFLQFLTSFLPLTRQPFSPRSTFLVPIIFFELPKDTNNLQPFTPFKRNFVIQKRIAEEVSAHQNQTTQYSALPPITSQLAAASFVLSRKPWNFKIKISLILYKSFNHTISFKKSDSLVNESHTPKSLFKF